MNKLIIYITILSFFSCNENQPRELNFYGDKISINNIIDFNKVKNLVENQTQRARHFYKLAIDNLPNADKVDQKPGLMMGNIYFVLLTKIVKNNPENLLNQRVGLSSFRKFLIALLTFFNYQ